MFASLCEGCGKLHGGDCPAPVTAPPPSLHGGDDELTPLGAVVEDAARYLAMRGYLDPDADGGVPDWVLAELAEIAHEKPCDGPGCSATADGFLSPSPAADHFLQRRQSGMGTLAAQVVMYLRQDVQGQSRTARYRLLRDHPGRDAGRPRGPRHARREAADRQGLRRLPRLWPPVRGYRRRTAGHASGRHTRTQAVRQPGAHTPPCSTATQQAAQPDQGTPPGRRPPARTARKLPSPGTPRRTPPPHRHPQRDRTRRHPAPGLSRCPPQTPTPTPARRKPTTARRCTTLWRWVTPRPATRWSGICPASRPPTTSRPDALALDAAWCAASGRRSFRESFAGDAQEVADRFTALAQAASAMARNLAAERYRAPKFRAALGTFTASATRLASRTRATAQNPDAWVGVLAGSPARTRSAGPAPGNSAAPGNAQPAAGTATAPPRPAPADETATDPDRDEPAAENRVSPGAAPLRNMDLAAELDRMPGEVFARWLSMGATPPAAGDLDYQRQGEGSQATAGEDGIEITVSGPDVTRHGLVTWPQAASWIDKGVTPARLGIVGHR